jgi:uncharacterized protein (TIGR03437 family)
MKEDQNSLHDTRPTRRDAIRFMGSAGMMSLVGWRDQSSPLWRLIRSEKPVSEKHSIMRLLQNALYTPQPRESWALSQLSCVTRPALTEGPFFVDELLNRSDIRQDPSDVTLRPGTPVKLNLNIGKVGSGSCTPLSGAFVDIWHCDAAGGYSDVNGQGNPNNVGKRFLRGYQVTDSNGAVEFTTIYPGWYSGRTVHIHYKVRLFAGPTSSFDFTSQLFFDDALTDAVFKAAPYNTRGTRDTRNSNDGIYQSGGSTTLLSLASDGASGYTANYDIGVSSVPDSIAGISAVSAASYQGMLTPEGIGAIFGNDLATSMVSATTTALPTELGGVRVVVLDASGTRRNAGLFFVSPAQINFQIPQGTAVGTAFVYVQRNGTSVGQGIVTIAAVAPALFAANTSGQGVAAAIVVRVSPSGAQKTEPAVQINSFTGAFEALPIDLGPSSDTVYLVPFGVGFRNRSSLTAVTATIGGTPVTVTFAGPQGTFAGLDQANILIPPSLAGRGDVDVVLTVDNRISNTVKVNIK